jgi:hypothetical protein
VGKNRRWRKSVYLSGVAVCVIVVAVSWFICCRMCRGIAGILLWRHIPSLVASELEAGLQTGRFQNYCLSNMPELSRIPLGTLKSNISWCAARYIVSADTDPSSGQKYGYSPVTPAGKALMLRIGTNTVDHGRLCFWLWDPALIDNRYRTLVFTDQSQRSLPDLELSWYYQCCLLDLTPVELEREMEYRRLHGLPALHAPE